MPERGGMCAACQRVWPDISLFAGVMQYAAPLSVLLGVGRLGCLEAAGWGL